MHLHRVVLGLAAFLSAGLLVCALLADEAEEGRRYALVVGVQNYEGTALGSLRYCDNDAAGLADALGKLGYHVTLMTRPEWKARDRDDLLPTADNIRDHLKAILRNRKPADTVLLAFAGHGEQLRKDGKMYFCPAKCDLDKPETLIGLDEVYGLLKDNPAGGKVLIVDACRNDPLAGRAVGSEKLESVTRPTLPDPPGGTVALFSCSRGEVAYESDSLKHGFLFHFVIDGLQGKAANKKDGRITWLGLAKHVDDELPDAVAEERGPKAVQTPEVRGVARGLVLGRIDGTSSPAVVGTTEPTPEPTPEPTKTDGPLTLTGHTDAVTRAAFSHDGKLVVTGSLDKTVKVWRGQNGHTLFPADGPVQGLAFGPSDKTLAVALGYHGDDRPQQTLLVWSLADNGAYWSRKVDFPALDVAYASDGRLAVGSAGWTSVFDTTGKPVWNHQEVTLVSEKRRLAFSPDGKWLAGASPYGLIDTFNASTGAVVWSNRPPAAFDPDHQDPTLGIIDFGVPKPGGALDLAYRPDGDVLAVGMMDGSLRLFDAHTGMKLNTFKPHQGYAVRAVAWRPDGKYLATGAGDKTIKIWDATTFKEQRILSGHVGPVVSLAFSPDGKRLVSASSDKTARIWDVDLGK